MKRAILYLLFAPAPFVTVPGASSSPLFVPVETHASNLWRDFLVAGMASALGAIGGAYAAFKMERGARRRDELDADALEAAQTLTVMADQLNALYNLRTQHLDEWRDSASVRWYMLPAATPLRFRRLDTVNLRYLMKNDGPLIAIKATIAERQLDVINDLLMDRRDIRVNHFEPKLQDYLRANRTTLLPSPEYITQHILGERYSSMLIRYTDDLYSRADLAILSIESTTRDLREFLRRVYPERAFYAAETPTAVGGNDALGGSP